MVMLLLLLLLILLFSHNNCFFLFDQIEIYPDILISFRISKNIKQRQTNKPVSANAFSNGKLNSMAFQNVWFWVLFVFYSLYYLRCLRTSEPKQMKRGHNHSYSLNC